MDFLDINFDKIDLSLLPDDVLMEFESIIAEIKNDQLRAQLKITGESQNPNFNFLVESLRNQKYENRLEVPDHLLGMPLTDAQRKLYTRPYVSEGFRGCVLEGSSRSGKTWSGIDFIIFICLYVETNCKINIVRETYAEFKETLYDDFKRRLDDFYLPNPFHTAKDVKSFKINGNTINFIGCDKVGKKHGAGCDYLFFNEMITIPKAVFDQLEMRCRKFWWADYNPSVTAHYIYDEIIPRAEIGYLRTTYLDNLKHISPGELTKILNSEPWLPGSYDIVNETEIYYKGALVDEKNQPPPHPKNVAQGTADEFYWKVYGLGLRGAMKGVIYKTVNWITEFPDMGFIYVNDFGFTADPNAFGKYAETETDIYFELKIYEPIETPELLSSKMYSVEAEKGIPIICDSSDKMTLENKGTVEMVKGLRAEGWEAKKVSKTKSIMYWILSAKNKRINFVINDLSRHLKKEQQNYRFMEIHGITINQPIDGFDHALSAMRYGHMAWNSPTGDIHW